MPISSSELKDWLAEKYREINPFTVVDIGPGAGTYSKLLRHTNTSVWTGVEIWEPYVSKYGLRDLYDIIEIQDAREYTPDEPVDLVIAGDVIEHMTQVDAVKFINRMKTVADHILISIPVGNYPQGEIEGNPHEAHLATWDHHEMQEVLADGLRDSAHGRRIGVYHWSKR